MVYIVNTTVVYISGMSRADPQMKIRLYDELKNSIDTAAKESGRTLNAEIVHRLEASFEQRESVEAHRSGTAILAKLNLALAFALDEVASYVPAKALEPGSAPWKAVRMAKALAESQKISVNGNSVMVFEGENPTKVTHIDLRQNLAAIEGYPPVSPVDDLSFERIPVTVRGKSNFVQVPKRSTSRLPEDESDRNTAAKKKSSGSVNKVLLVGNLGREPETRSLPELDIIKRAVPTKKGPQPSPNARKRKP